MQRARLLALVLMSVMLASLSCSPHSFAIYAFAAVQLDVQKQILTPVAPIGFECPRSARQCYSRLTDSRGRHHITHRGPFLQGNPSGSSIVYNVFSTEQDHSLITRSKYQLLLSGPYGNVYAHSIYYYAPQYAAQRNTFEVLGYLTNIPFEPSQGSGALPDDLRLDAISLVRIFRHAPGFLVISADYGTDGRLWAFHVNGTSGGLWTNMPEDSARAQVELGLSTIGDRSAEREAFGFPVSFPLAGYDRSPTRVWQPASYVEHLSVVTLHYENNRWARQHQFAGDALVETRTLRYAATAEDQLLEALDAQRGFGR